MTKRVALLRFVETVGVQPEALTWLGAGGKTDGPHDALETAVVEIARQMGALEQALIADDIDGLHAAAGCLGAAGEKFGFGVVTQVAGDLIDCTRRHEVPAVHAVAERLIRVGDASLAAVIEQAMP